MREIDTVIFDIGEVLFRGFHGFEDLLSQELDCYISNQVLQTPELYDYFLGIMTENDMWLNMIKRFHWKTNTNILRRLMRRNFQQISGSMQLVRELKRNGYALGILSVHGLEWVQYLEQTYDFEKYFDHIEYSCLRGILKPAPEAFTHAVRGLAASYSSCLYVDDFHINIEAAAKLGMQTHLFTAPDLLLFDLEEMQLL